MAEVVTRGSGEHEQVADRAELRVTFAAEGADRSSAVAELGSRVRPAERAMDRDGVEVRARNMVVRSAWEGKRRTGCRAQLSLTIRVHRVEALEDLLDALLGAEPESLHGPSWQLSDDSEATVIAQQRAVEQARRRAEGYASALGARLGTLQSITDVCSERPTARMAAESTGSPGVAELGLEPMPVTVTAACTTVWTLLE